MRLSSKFLALLPLFGMQIATTGVEAVSPHAQLKYYRLPECVVPVPPKTVQELTLTTDVPCYNLSFLAASYQGYLLEPLPVGLNRCALNLYTYPDCVEVASDSGPLKQDAGRCIEIPNVPYGAQSASVVCST